MLSHLNDAFSAPHFGATLETGGKPSTTDAFEFTNKNHRGPRIVNPNQENERWFIPCAKRGGLRTSDSEGRWGPSEREEGRSQNQNLQLLPITPGVEIAFRGLRPLC